MPATRTPARMAASKPIHGFRVKTVTAAAVKAPASMIPSSAMLMIPPRSEYRPPSAARIIGVASLMVDAISVMFRMSPNAPTPFHEHTEQCFTGDKEDNDALKNLHQVLGNM